MAILQDNAAILKQIEALKAQNEALRQKLEARNNRALSFKVSEKGAVSVYGLGRFPVTLYYTQWVKLSKGMGDVMAFVEAEHEAGNLTTKDD